MAKLRRAGELTAVWVPDAAHEAMRDLIRARATAVRVLGKARQHLQGFLLRHDETLLQQPALMFAVKGFDQASVLWFSGSAQALCF
jgi:transposase